MRTKVKKNSLAIKILKVIGVAGMIAIAAASPYFGLGLIRGVRRRYDKKTWRKFYQSLYYLNRRGHVNFLGTTADGEINVEITEKGKTILGLVDIDSMKLARSPKWDGKWRIVIFDVPNTKNRQRTAFAGKLRELGFIMVQKSVWAYPFECRKEVMILRKFYEVEPYVTYLEGIEVEDEFNWRGKFNLKTGAV
jgi:hypothetical protein